MVINLKQGCENTPVFLKKANEKHRKKFFEKILIFVLTNAISSGILINVLRTCASGSAVEHLLAKEGVAGSIPVSRFFHAKVYALAFVIKKFVFKLR